MSKWFAGEKLTINLDKTSTIQVMIYNLPYCAFSSSYKEKWIEERVNA